MFFLTDKEITALESCVDVTENEGYNVDVERVAIRKIKEAAQQSVQADKCPDCGGSGFMVKIDNRKVSCSYCDGTGICR